MRSRKEAAAPPEIRGRRRKSGIGGGRKEGSVRKWRASKFVLSGVWGLVKCDRKQPLPARPP